MPCWEYAAPNEWVFKCFATTSYWYPWSKKQRHGNRCRVYELPRGFSNVLQQWRPEISKQIIPITGQQMSKPIAQTPVQCHFTKCTGCLLNSNWLLNCYINPSSVKERNDPWLTFLLVTLEEIKKIPLVTFPGYDFSTKPWKSQQQKITSCHHYRDVKINIVTQNHIYFVWENFCYH